MPKQKFDWLTYAGWAGIGGIATIIGVLCGIFGSPLTWFSSSNPKPPNPPAIIVSSPVVRANATPTPMPPPTEVITPTETPSPMPTATSSCPTAPAETPATAEGVIAVVTGCPSVPVTWVFGFVQGNGIGITSGGSGESFMSYGAGQSLGYISQLGVSPTQPYSGPPLTSWLFWVNSGGYAIVMSDNAAQPTFDQLGIAVQHGGFVGWGDGTYLPQTYELTSTTPQPGGVQGYQFNLVVKKS